MATEGLREKIEWKCAGCGKPSPDMLRNCDCITSCLWARGHGSAWKIEPGSKEDWERRAQAAEARLAQLEAEKEGLRAKIARVEALVTLASGMDQPVYHSDIFDALKEPSHD